MSEPKTESPLTPPTAAPTPEALAPNGQSVAVMKRAIEDATVQKINAVLAESGCQLVPAPAFVPDGNGGFRLTIGVNVKFGG